MRADTLLRSGLAVVKRLSSFRPECQERLGGAEAAGLLGRFRSTRLRGRGEGRSGHGLPKP